MDKNKSKKEELVKKRLELCSDIVHAKLMIQRNYNPDFFKKQIKRYKEKQIKYLKLEREL
jgi:hypothetical protein